MLGKQQNRKYRHYSQTNDSNYNGYEICIRMQEMQSQNKFIALLRNRSFILKWSGILVLEYL